MQHILVYGDSLSWGIVPGTRQRLAFYERWPGVVEADLLRSGCDVRVTEDCLNGRRTVFESPSKPGRNGVSGLEQVVEAHAPLDLVVLMLGTNDFQADQTCDASRSAAGLEALVRAIRQSPIEPGCPIPPVLVIAPPPIVTPRGDMGAKFAGASSRSVGLAEAYEKVADRLKCVFLDAATVVSTSDVDGVHLDAESHLKLGQAVANVVAPLLLASSEHDQQDGRAPTSLAPLELRQATEDDVEALARWNKQLIDDEGHRNAMTIGQLADRMRHWLADTYRAVIFEAAGHPVAYALYEEQPDEIHLRQFFVVRDRRRQGTGRSAIARLREHWPNGKRLTVEVLTANTGATAFWRSVGYRDYSLMLERV